MRSELFIYTHAHTDTRTNYILEQYLLVLGRRASWNCYWNAERVFRKAIRAGETEVGAHNQKR